MIDTGLLASIIVAIAIPSLFVKPWPPEVLSDGILDAALGAAVIGVLVGRFTALAFDDPSSLTNLSSILVVRSGVEFWPGALAAGVWLAIRARREHAGIVIRLAALAPALLVGWALYEGTCLLRGGCPGPVSSIGLRPQGLSSRMFPVGLGVAAVAVLAAVAVSRLQRAGLSSVVVVISCVLAASLIRSVSSFWLPHIGTGLTRQHRMSIAVLGFSVLVLAGIVVSRSPSTKDSRT